MEKREVKIPKYKVHDPEKQRIYEYAKELAGGRKEWKNLSRSDKHNFLKKSADEIKVKNKWTSQDFNEFVSKDDTYEEDEQPIEPEKRKKDTDDIWGEFSDDEDIDIYETEAVDEEKDEGEEVDYGDEAEEIEEDDEYEKRSGMVYIKSNSEILRKIGITDKNSQK